jgi:hypothetical protein
MPLFEVYTTIKNETKTIQADKWEWVWVGYPFTNGVQFLTAPDRDGQRYIVDTVFNVPNEPRQVS